MRATVLIALAMALISSIAPRQAAAAIPMPPIRVVATTTDIKDLVQTIGGNQVEVESLAAPLQDPHTL